MASFCECGDEHSGPTEIGKFLDRLRDC